MDAFSVLLVAALLALAPTVIYALIIWWLDRHEKEPLPLLLVAFVWGAGPAIVLALLLEIGAGIPLEAFDLTDNQRDFTEAGLIAPVVEEAVKAIILVVLFLAYRREFDNVLDGIVYGAMVGLGFALVENVLYFISAAYEEEMFVGEPNIGSMVGLWLLRAGLFGLNHSMFTAFTGAALGLARSMRQGWQQGLVVSLGLAAAMGFHAIHNGLAITAGTLAADESNAGLALGACFGMLLSNWGGILVVFVVAIVSGVREGHIMRETLWEEVALGRFTPDEYNTLISGSKRWGSRLNVLTSEGFRRWRQVGKFFDLATELAFLKHRLRDGDPIHQNLSARDIARLRGEIDRLTGRVVMA